MKCVNESSKKPKEESQIPIESQEERFESTLERLKFLEDKHSPKKGTHAHNQKL